MSFENTIAKIFFDRVERDLDKFNLTMSSLRNYFHESLADRGNRSIEKILSNSIFTLEGTLASHVALISLTSAKIKGKMYGQPYHYLSMFSLTLDEETGWLNVGHDGFCMSKKKLFFEYYTHYDYEVVLTKHAIDRVYERHPIRITRRNTNEFISNIKQLLICLILEIKNRDHGELFFVPVPGGAFACGRDKEKIIVKTFYGPDEVLDKWPRYEDISIETLKFATGLLTFFEIADQNRESFELFKQKQHVLNSKLWVPKDGSMVCFQSSAKA